MITDEYKKYHDIDYVSSISSTNGPTDIDILFNNGHRITFSYDRITAKKMSQHYINRDIMKKVDEYEYKNRREKIEKIINKYNVN